MLPLEICDGHDVGNKPLSCINCARQLGRKEGLEEAHRAMTHPETETTALIGCISEQIDNVLMASGGNGYRLVRRQADKAIADAIATYVQAALDAERLAHHETRHAVDRITTQLAKAEQDLARAVNRAVAAESQLRASAALQGDDPAGTVHPSPGEA